MCGFKCPRLLHRFPSRRGQRPLLAHAAATAQTRFVTGAQ
jgi:hypothetical protein